jgi:hypothetical protein
MWYEAEMLLVDSEWSDRHMGSFTTDAIQSTAGATERLAGIKLF